MRTHLFQRYDDFPEHSAELIHRPEEKEVYGKIQVVEATDRLRVFALMAESKAEVVELADTPS